jgi:hypothetical protein
MGKFIEKLMVALLLGPPIYIILRFLGWTLKQERKTREDS